MISADGTQEGQLPLRDAPTGRAQLEHRLVNRAQRDPAFRERLLANPRAAVEEELDVVLPAGLRIDVVQERPDRLCLVLPVDLSQMSDGSLSAMTGVPIQRDAPIEPSAPE